MKRLISSILALACLANVVQGEDALPKVIQDQIDLIQPAIEKDKADFMKKVKLENDRLMILLQRAADKEAKAGNLENAIALKDEIEKVKSGELIESLMKPQFPNSMNNFVKSVEVFSAGFTAGNCKVMISINGKEMVNTDGRGITLYAFKDGQEKLRKTYDTFDDKSANKLILKDVQALTNGTLFIAGVSDDATTSFTEDGQKALVLAGAKKGLLNQPYRCSYVMISIIGDHLIFEKIGEGVPVKFPGPVQ